MMLHPNIIVHVVNVVCLFSSPSTSSQKVRKCVCIYENRKSHVNNVIDFTHTSGF